MIALDMRSHGESMKAAGGHRIQRLAMDLSEVIDALELSSVDVLGHSMGSSIIWSYLDLFGPRKLRKLVIVDQAPMVAALPAWSDAEQEAIWMSDAGCSGGCSFLRYGSRDIHGRRHHGDSPWHVYVEGAGCRSSVDRGGESENAACRRR